MNEVRSFSKCFILFLCACFDCRCFMFWGALFMPWGFFNAVPQFLHLPCWCARPWGQHFIPSGGSNRQLLREAWQWLRNECIIVFWLGTWKLLLQHDRQCLHLERVGQKMDMCKENWSPIRFRCQILHNCVEALEASAQVALTCQWCGMLAGWCPWNPTRSTFVVCGRPGRPSGWSFRFLWVSDRIQSLFSTLHVSSGIVVLASWGRGNYCLGVRIAIQLLHPDTCSTVKM